MDGNAQFSKPNRHNSAHCWTRMDDVFAVRRHLQESGFRCGQHDRLSRLQIEQAVELLRLVARGQSNGHDNIVVVDEFPRETIDRCGSAGRHYPQARHAPQSGLRMKLLGREGLDVPLGQSSAVYLTTRIKALVRRIIRSREPNDLAIAVADSCDAARSAHGQTPARRALSARRLPRRTYIPGHFSRSIEASDSRFRRILFALGWARGGSEMGSSCAHEGRKRRSLRCLSIFQRECGREPRSVPPHQREPLSTGRSSPTQLSRQSKSGRAEIASYRINGALYDEIMDNNRF